MPLLQSKLRVPTPPPQTIDRPRLLDRISSRPWKLVSLQAPAGYGKSILAAQVRARDPHHTAWFYTEPEDADAQRFVRYLGQALAQVVPELAQTELVNPGEGDAFEAQSWVENLLLYFQEFPRLRVRVILDDYDSIADHADITRIIERLLFHARGGITFLLTSRREPRLHLSKLVVGQDALVLSAQDLAFTLEEFQEAVALHGPLLTVQQTEELWEESQGWCVSLGMAVAGHASPDPGQAEAEILRSVSPRHRELLIASALLDVVSPQGLQALGLDVDFAEYEALLREHAIPHLRLEGDDGSRLHPLVRTHLLADVRGKTNEAYEGLLEKAVTFSLLQKNPASALRLLLDLGASHQLLETIERAWPLLEEQNLLPRVQGWLDALPAALHSQPQFILMRMRVLQVLGESRSILDYAQEVRSAGLLEETSPFTLRMWIIESWAQILLGLVRYDELLAQWSKLGPTDDPTDTSQAEHMLQMASIYALRFEASLRNMSAVGGPTFQENRVERARNRNIQGVILHEVGRSQEALEAFHEVITMCRSRGETRYHGYALLGMAFAYKDLGRLQEALQAVQECEEIERDASFKRRIVEAHAFRVRGEVYWFQGRRTEAFAQLQQSVRLFQDHNRYEALATGILLDHWRMLSGERSRQVPDDAFEGSFSVSEARVRHLIHLGRRHAREGEWKQGAESCRQAFDMAAEMPAWRATARFTEAFALAGMGDQAGRDEALRTGLDNLEYLDRAAYPLADPELTAWIVATAVARDILPQRAKSLCAGEIRVDLTPAFKETLDAEKDGAVRTRLLRAATELGIRGLEQAVGAPSSDPVEKAYVDFLENAPLPSLMIRLLGRLEVLVTGREVRFSRTASRRVLEILLLDHPRGVHEERFMDALWPDMHPDKAKRSLQTAINELRKDLDPYHRARGRSYIDYEGEHYSLRLPAGSWVDMHRFQELLSRDTRQRADAETARRQLREAIALYRGDLLEEEPYEDFAAETRERFRSLFLEASVQLVESVGTSKPAEAIAVLERGLEIDPYWSEGTKLLMQTLEKQGRVLAAIRAYREYEARLVRDLGVEPDPPLTKLFRELTGG